MPTTETDTIERPYQFEQLANLGQRVILPHADPRIVEEIVERLASGPKSVHVAADHFLQFHFGQYQSRPTRENRLELLAIMAAYEDIAENTPPE
jgi:hypothetical protein